MLNPTSKPDAESASQEQAPASLGVHPIAIEAAIAAALWFIAVTWLAFARGIETDYLLAIVTLFFVIFFILFLFTATYSRGDPRWPTKRSGRARLWRDAYRSGLGDFRLSSAARASSASREAAKLPATHSASTWRRISPMAGPFTSPSAMMSGPRKGNSGTSQRSARRSARRQF